MSGAIFRTSLLAISVGLFAAAHTTQAQQNSYKAVVVKDKVQVRAGAGNPFYVVGQLKKGDTVRVNKVLYGWYMIVPPESCYSYVRRSKVRVKSGGKTGVINKSGTRIMAGSADGPGASYKRQVDLKNNTAIQIIKQEGDYFRIKAPQDAFVYIPPGSISRGGSANVAKPATPKPSAPKAAKPEATKQPAKSAPSKTPSKTQVQPARTSKKTIYASAVGNAVSAEAAASDKAPVVAKVAPVNKPATFLDSLSDNVRHAEEHFRVVMKLPLEQRPLRKLVIAFSVLNMQDEQLTDQDRRLVKHRLNYLKQNHALVSTLKDLAKARAQLAQAPKEKPQVAPAPTPDYDFVGKVRVSHVYNGQALPRLFRLVDSKTNSTIAYIRPSSKLSPVDHFGKTLGIVGQRKFDRTLNLELIEIKQIDPIKIAPAKDGQSTEITRAD
jgi:hypothetical protein